MSARLMCCMIFKTMFLPYTCVYFAIIYPCTPITIVYTTLCLFRDVFAANTIKFTSCTRMIEGRRRCLQATGASRQPCVSIPTITARQISSAWSRRRVGRTPSAETRNGHVNTAITSPRRQELAQFLVDHAAGDLEVFNADF